MKIEITENIRNNLIAFLERTNLTGKEVQAYNECMVFLLTAKEVVKEES